MNYERAWKELEGVIKGTYCIYSSAFMYQEKSAMDMTIVNTLEAVNAIMENLREKYEQEEISEL